jgi:hypothetical protein
MKASLDELWSQIPTGTPPVAEMVRDGRRLRRTRRRMTALTVAAVGVLVVGGGAVAQQTVDTSPQTPRVVPVDSPAPPSKVDVVVYYLVDKAERPDGRFRRATQITPRAVTVENTGDPAYDAVHALLAVEPPEAGLSSGFNFLESDQIETIDVTEVRHQEGVVTIDFTQDPWDPYPTVDFCCSPDGETVTQQLVHTAQTALDTDDPVRFTTKGEPVEGIWFHRLRGPVPAEPDIVRPPD